MHSVLVCPGWNYAGRSDQPTACCCWAPDGNGNNKVEEKIKIKANTFHVTGLARHLTCTPTHSSDRLASSDELYSPLTRNTI
jgi:hypothetical protein